MLILSAAFLALLGFGFPLLSGSDDHDDVVSEDESDTKFESKVETISLGSFLEFSQTGTEFETDSSSSTGATTFAGESDSSDDTLGSLPEPTSQPDDNSDETRELVKENESSRLNLVAGGPGDILVGDSGVDGFVVTVGQAGDPETVIENLFDVDGNIDEFDPDQKEKIEKIWLRGSNGDFFSREYLLLSDLEIIYDEDRGGVGISLRGHITVFVEDTYLNDFTENSLVLGNFALTSQVP